MRHWRYALLVMTLACAGRARPNTGDSPPSTMVGTFVDDYGSRYTISATEWLQQPRNRYRIVRWNVAEQYIIAQNDSGNATSAGRWTRIDWMPFSGMPPYDWGYCYTVYEAASPAAAESTPSARRDTPRTGCNGHPFSRMSRATTP